MGGVDMADMLISLYRVKSKTKRWYIKIFCKVNAWNLYRRHQEQKRLPKCRMLSLLSFSSQLVCIDTCQQTSTP